MFSTKDDHLELLAKTDANQSLTIKPKKTYY